MSWSSAPFARIPMLDLDLPSASPCSYPPGFDQPQDPWRCRRRLLERPPDQLISLLFLNGDKNIKCFTEVHGWNLSCFQCRLSVMHGSVGVRTCKQTQLHKTYVF